MVHHTNLICPLCGRTHIEVQKTYRKIYKRRNNRLYADWGYSSAKLTEDELNQVPVGKSIICSNSTECRKRAAKRKELPAC